MVEVSPWVDIIGLHCRETCLCHSYTYIHKYKLMPFENSPSFLLDHPHVVGSKVVSSLVNVTGGLARPITRL